MKNNIVGWLEIPVEKMDRAVKFYELLLDIKIQTQQFGTLEMAFFPFKEDGSGAPGSLVKHSEYKPSKEGVLIYLTSPSGDLANELSKVEDAGGQVLSHKKQISEENGYMGLFLDSEGNRIAIHSRK